MNGAGGGGTYQIPISASSGAGAAAGAGDFIVTGGGAKNKGLLPELPKVSADKAWIVWVALAAVAGAVVLLLIRRK